MRLWLTITWLTRVYVSCQETQQKRCFVHFPFANVTQFTRMYSLNVWLLLFHSILALPEQW